MICPCCGSKFEGDLRVGCSACGARAVGPPLARPEQDLPSYGFAVLVGLAGALLILIFSASTFAALLERKPFSLGFWDIVAASETAAWRLKWLAGPLVVLSLWASAWVCAKIRREPQRFTGLRFARAGLVMSVAFSALITIFIGRTIPERLRQRQLAREAAHNALLHAFDRAVLEYRAHYGTYPANLQDLKRLPDPDGSIVAVLTRLSSSTYTAKVDIAASMPPVSRRSRALRGAAARLRPIATQTNTDDAPGERVPFTNYELVWPGEDNIPGTDDDRVIRDGVLVQAEQSSKQSLRASSKSNMRKP